MNKFELLIDNIMNINKPKIQVCSDVHLENNDIKESDFTKILVPVASILVLAGDIGEPFSSLFENFVDYCSNHFENVLFVAGNHEYYGHSIEEVDNKIKMFSEKYENFYYLNNEIFEYEDICFIGTTLWTDLNGMKNDDLLSVMRDFREIKDFTPESEKNKFKQNIELIEKHLREKKCIVITHHAPSYECIDIKFKDDKFRSCFASDLEHLFTNKNMVGWIYGHLHHNKKINANKYFLYTNCFRTDNYSNNVSV